MQKRNSRLIVSGPLPPPLGGMESYCDDYLKTEVCSHFEVIFCPSILIKCIGSAKGVSGFVLRSLNRGLTLFVWFFALVFKRPNIAHVHTNSGVGFYARGWMTLWAERLGVRSILHMHGAAFKEFYAGLSSVQKIKALRLLQANTFLMVLSETWEEFFVSIGVPKEKIVIMRNSVFLSEISLDSKKEGKLTALYLSRIERRKGVFELIDAIDKNRELLDSYEFVIAGPESDDYWEIKERIDGLGISKSVKMPGPLVGEEKAAAYSNADVYLLQSFAEGMPIGLLEAMSYGLTCISTPVGGIPDVIRHNENGLLIPPGDPAALAEVLQTLAKHPSMRKSIGLHAREIIEKKYNWESRSEQLLSLYEAMI